MSDTRKLTIGVTINLGNCENLHLEVSDIAETEYDATDLRKFLVSVLDGYGKNDFSVRQAIAEYCRKVLAENNIDDNDSSAAKDETNENDEIMLDAFSTFVPGSDEEKSSDTSIDFILEKDSSFDDNPEVNREVIAEDDYMRLPPAPLVEVSAEEFVCSKCGATVSKLQRDVSMLFNHKILCKDCMK